MAGANVCIKYSMFIFNLFFWLCGILILAIAIWAKVSKDKQELLKPEESSDASENMLIAIGTIIMILGFLGCYGAIKENRCMLLLFFIGLFLILLLHLAAGIVGSSLKSETERSLNQTLHEHALLLSETSEEGKKFQKEMISFQGEFKCCGLVQGAADWGNNFEQAYESCKCSSSSDSCTFYSGKYVHKQTCMSPIKEAVSNHIRIIMGISFGLAFMEIIGMVFSMTLYCQIRKK